MKRLIQGVGTNDAGYKVHKKNHLTGKREICPFYKKWSQMLERCYSDLFRVKNPTYENCKVCDEWLIFSNFKSWMEKQDWKGKELDKDLLSNGCDIYSPETCIFISKRVNQFISKSKGDKAGTAIDKDKGKYRSVAHNPITKSREHLGYFDTPEESHNAWLKRKAELAELLAKSELVDSDIVANALINRYKAH